MIEINFTYVIQIINFLILMALLYKFLYKKILEILDNRADNINESLQEAAEAKQKSTELYERCVSEFERVQAESLNMKEQARTIGNSEKERIIDTANHKAESLMSQAKKELNQELNKAKEELKNDIGNLSVKISEKIIKEKLSSQNKEKLTEQALKELESL